MTDIDLGDHKYRINKMSVFDQAHVARKVAPVVIGLGQGYATAIQAQPQPLQNGHEVEVVPEQENAFFFTAFGPIADVLARMEEEDVDYVLKKCLAAVGRHNGNTYVPMMRAGQLMFDDTDLATIMQLVMEVVTDNLGPSLRALLPLASRSGDQPSP